MSNEALEQRAREHLAARRFRKARDNFKELCKQDRARFLPLLIEANIGLVQDMLAKGLLSEAQTVVAYLKTIAPPEVLKSLELQLLCKSGDSTKVVPQVVGLLASSQTQMSEAERNAWADQLVVAFAPVSANSTAEARVAGEVAAVHQALEAISMGQNESALEAVRPLARDSAFSHWKLFIKGLVAFHGGDAEKAIRCFSELPVDSTLGRAREPYLLLLKPETLANRTVPEAVVQAAARIAGHGGLGRLLWRAEALWKTNRPTDAYTVFRDGLPSFPSEGLDFPAVLSEFFFNSLFTLSEELHFDCKDYFLDIEEERRAKNITEQMLIQRAYCLMLHKVLEPSVLKEKWEAFLQAHARVRGDNPRLASLGYGWLGEVFAAPGPRRIRDYGAKPPLFDAPGAIAALKTSIELDPANAAAHLKLSAVYESQKMMSERNRLLDTMTVRFPDHKEVLLLAGAACLEREAFAKGIDYCERAIKLDRIDPSVPDLLASCSYRLAAQYFEKGRLEQARKTLARLEELLVEQSENFLRNAWCWLARRALFEQKFGDAAEGTALLSRARQAAPFPAMLLLFVQLVSRISKENHPPFEREFSAALKQEPNARCGAALARLFFFCRKQEKASIFAREEQWLEQYLKAAIKQPFTREEARCLVELLEREKKFDSEARAFVKKVLKQDKRDPLFRYYEYALQAFHLSDPDEDHHKLKRILDEATRGGDEATAKLVRQAMAELHALPAVPVPDWAEEPDEPAPFSPDLLPPFISPNDTGVIAEILAALQNASESEIRQLRKKRPKEISAEMFDLFVNVARGNGPLPPLRPIPHIKRPTAGPTPQPPPSDPNQLNLF